MSQLTSLLKTDDKNVTENRQMFVGGSDVPVILGISKYKTQYELAKEKVGISTVTYEGNEYTVYGQTLEPQIRDYINAINETNFKPDQVIDKELGVRGNCDGADYTESLLLEIKTHGKKPTMEVYKAQVQLYLKVFNLPAGWLALYERPDNFDAEFNSERLKIEVVHRDEEYINRITNAIDTFWIRCEYLKEKPDMTEAEFMSTGQNELSTLVNQIEKLEFQIASFKEIEQQYKDKKAQLHDLMEDYDIKKWETDHVVITRILPGTRESIDGTKLKKEHPELAEQYKKISKVAGSVRIKLKEAK